MAVHGAPVTEQPPMPSVRGVLLVEFIPDCPCVLYEGAAYFPLLQAFLKSKRVPVSWVYVARTSRYQGDLTIIGPEPAHVDAIVREAERLDASLIVANQQWTGQFEDTVRSRLPETRLVLGGSGAPGLWFGLALSPQSIWPSAERWLISAAEDIEPDFSAENLMNAEIGIFPSQKFELRKRRFGGSCPHHAPIASNTYYEGLNIDFSILKQTVGCSFCLDIGNGHGSAGGGAREEDEIERLVADLRAYIATSPPERRGGPYLFTSYRAFPAVYERLLDLPLPPSVFFVLRRFDEILGAEDTWRRIVPSYAARGHRIVFDCVGVENFSPRENERLNKRLSPQQVEASLLLLNELESTWPDTVWFFRNGYGQDGSVNTATGVTGMMMIMFTPWTELEDLAINHEALDRLSRRIGALRWISSQLISRLRLYPGTAVVELAKRDGLLCDRFPPLVHPALVGSDQIGNEEDIPWRFAKDEVGRVFSVLSWIFMDIAKCDTAPHPDEVFRRRVRFVTECFRKGAVSLLWVFGQLIEVARESPPGESEEGMLERLVGRCRGLASSALGQAAVSALLGLSAGATERLQDLAAGLRERRGAGYRLASVAERLPAEGASAADRTCGGEPCLDVTIETPEGSRVVTLARLEHGLVASHVARWFGVPDVGATPSLAVDRFFADLVEQDTTAGQDAEESPTVVALVAKAFGGMLRAGSELGAGWVFSSFTVRGHESLTCHVTHEDGSPWAVHFRGSAAGSTGRREVLMRGSWCRVEAERVASENPYGAPGTLPVAARAALIAEIDRKVFGRRSELSLSSEFVVALQRHPEAAFLRLGRRLGATLVNVEGEGFDTFRAYFQSRGQVESFTVGRCDGVVHATSDLGSRGRADSLSAHLQRFMLAWLEFRQSER